MKLKSLNGEYGEISLLMRRAAQLAQFTGSAAGQFADRTYTVVAVGKAALLHYHSDRKCR